LQAPELSVPLPVRSMCRLSCAGWLSGASGHLLQYLPMPKPLRAGLGSALLLCEALHFVGWCFPQPFEHVRGRAVCEAQEGGAAHALGADFVTLWSMSRAVFPRCASVGRILCLCVVAVDAAAPVMLPPIAKAACGVLGPTL
jgi:hypothetical protein